MAKRLKGFKMVWCWVLSVLAVLGGLELIGLSYNWFSVLAWMGAPMASFVQLLAGIFIVWTAVWMLMRCK